jgi:hypothetical protein
VHHRKIAEFAIACNDEAGTPLISNKRREEIWSTLRDLVVCLLKDSKLSSEDVLFAWMKEPRHLASSREPYGWRAVLEEIKNSDLGTRCESFRKDPEEFVLITDKPVMLKIAGEITNCLLHSYTSRHRISFAPVQSTSKVPS